MLYIRNALILTPDGTVFSGTVEIKNGVIQSIGTMEGPPPPDAEVVDAQGLLLAPGFIDLQLNGGFGQDFTEHPESLWHVASSLPRFGVTAFLPTIITSPAENVMQGLSVLQAGPPAGWQGAAPLGFHLEGPMLNPGKKGAHNPAHIRPPSLEVIDGWSAAQGVRLVTLAPEIPGALEVAAALQERGIIVSAGHSLASYEQAKMAFDAGIRKVTHLFNAMPPLDHRSPGLAGAALEDDRVITGIIPDGIHVHPTVVRLIWQSKGRHGTAIVTDSMAAMGMPPGAYRLADYDVVVDERSARLANGTLAGSIVTMDAAVRNMAAWSGAGLYEAALAASQTPASLLGLKNKGRIAVGADADLILLDVEGRVHQTYTGGKLVFKA